MATTYSQNFVSAPSTSGQLAQKKKPIGILPKTGAFSLNPSSQNGLLTSSNLGSGPSTSGLKASQYRPGSGNFTVNQAEEFKRKYGFDMPGTQNAQQIGIKADSPAIKPKTNTLSNQFQAPQSSSLPNYSGLPLNGQNGFAGSGGQVGLNGQPEQMGGSSGPNYQGLYGQLIKMLQARGQGDSPEIIKAREDLKQSQLNQAGALAANSSNPIPLEFQQGRAQVLNTQYGQQQTALSNALQSATSTQGQQIGALQGAAGLAQPQLAGYAQQAFNPLTGQFSGGDLQGAVGNVVQRLQSGTMSYNDALSALSGYGQGGVNALQQALGPNFNIAQSNTLAGQQGSIGPNYELANRAISNLENAVKNLGFAQGTNIPGVNLIGNTLSGLTGAGSQQTREYQQAVQSARQAYAALIASVKGGTPTDYSSQAIAEVPDNPTPNDIAALRHSFEVLGQARKSIYGNPGAIGGSSAGTGGLFDW